MVERTNQKGRPPGCSSQVTLDLQTTSELSCSLLDHWMSHELGLDLLGSEQDDDYNKPQTLPKTSAVSIPENVPTTLVNGSEINSPLQFELDLNSFYGHESMENLLQCSNCSNNVLKIEDNYEFKDHGISVWGTPMDIDPLKLDEVFQVDTSDLAQSPTLAELNSYDEPFFDLEFGPHFSKTSNVGPEPTPKRRFTLDESLLSTQTTTTSQSNESIPQNCTPNVFLTRVIKTEAVDETKPPEMLVKDSTALSKSYELQATSNLLSTSMKIEKNTKLEKISPKVSIDEKVTSKLANPKKKLQPISKGSGKIPRRHRNRSGVSTCSISSWSSLSHDDLETDEDDNDSDDQFSSDNEGIDLQKYESSKTNTSSLLNNSSTTFSTLKSTKNNKTKRYFWQYNIQSKGPKVGGPTRIVLPHNILDPHILDDARDPVFSPACNLDGVKHSGKARRGDGNDLTPCPRKLRSIGMELDALNSMINDLTPVSDVPFNARPRTRKEKNKLASRACRLKKKAQHEANKVKLYGLQKEHQMLNGVIKDVRRLLLTEVEAFMNRSVTGSRNPNKYQLKDSDFKEKVDKLMVKSESLQVAGCSAEFVNSILEKVSSGQPTGGMEDL